MTEPTEQNTNPIALQLILYKLLVEANEDTDAIAMGVKYAVDVIVGNLNIPDNWIEELESELDKIQAHIDDRERIGEDIDNE